MASANPPVNQCPVCLDEHTILRVLGCKHLVCDACVAKLKSTAPCVPVELGHDCSDDDEYEQCEQIACPVDRSYTTKIDELKTKLFVDMKCEQCDNVHSFNEYWWCEDCCSSICGDCAMRKHRHHTCTAWNECDNIVECYNFCKKLNSNRLSREDVVQWCSNLQAELLKILDENAVAPAIDKLTQIFGENDLPSHVDMVEYHGLGGDSTRKKCHYTNWMSKTKKIQSKKWNTISRLLQTMPNGTPLPDYDSVGLVKLPDVKVVVAMVAGATVQTSCECCDAVKTRIRYRRSNEDDPALFLSQADGSAVVGFDSVGGREYGGGFLSQADGSAVVGFDSVGGREYGGGGLGGGSGGFGGSGGGFGRQAGGFGGETGSWRERRRGRGRATAHLQNPTGQMNTSARGARRGGGFVSLRLD